MKPEKTLAEFVKEKRKKLNNVKTKMKSRTDMVHYIDLRTFMPCLPLVSKK